MSAQQRILIVDDEESMRQLLEIVLSNDGHYVESMPDVKSACEILESKHFDLVLTDLRMGADRNAGMSLLSWLKKNSPRTPSIMITAHGSVETAIEAMKRGATDYIMKPFKNDEIRLIVQRAIEQRNLIRENVALRKAQAKFGNIDDMIGNCPVMDELVDLIRRVASLPSTVAIHGESGTGKELVARAIHNLSERVEKPFVAVNCGGIPENLLESELFGHKKGSFTSATEDKEGLFVSANGGTLLLDEIGEMPLALQVKLLRVLSDNIVMPVGSTTGITVDVRLLSATNRDLEKMVKEGIFREDLYYRLNVIPITVPALRERADDIPLLARSFVKKFGKKLNREDLDISPEAEDIMRNFNWPGNVRELENTLERAVALCATSKIEICDLPQNIRNPVSESVDVAMELPSGGLDLEELVENMERSLIIQALDKTRHSQKKAAKLLNLTPRSLRYRLQKYGLSCE